MEAYNLIADEEELKWFFNNVIYIPTIIESYSMVLAARFKKLTDEEKQSFGITRRDAEFLMTQSVRSTKQEDKLVFTFDKFIQKVRRFNVDKKSVLTSGGVPVPDRTLVVLFYINPCNELKVTDKLLETITSAKSAIMTAYFNGKTIDTSSDNFRLFGKLDSTIQHYRANCKGSTYWVDYDLDCPSWFKEKYYNSIKDKLSSRFGIGNYVVVDTSGGYHILVRTHAIKSDPHIFCDEVTNLYKEGVANGNPEYVDDKGNIKFEINLHNSNAGIPGIPLPGTYQYGRPVTVINKGDFNYDSN